jgi:hypothetical protein
MSEYGQWHKENLPIGKPMLGLGKEMLYGSNKQYFWYNGSDLRVLVDTNQGGSIGDLRPYIGKFEMTTGPDSKFMEIASYPYIIHSIYRTGTVTHSADGARTTLYVSDGNEKFDLCYFRTKVSGVERKEDFIKLKLNPITINFKNGNKAKIETSYEFLGDGKINIIREIDTDCENLSIQEYCKGCYGFTEYAENLNGIELIANDEKISFSYGGKSKNVPNCNKATAKIDQINVSINLEAIENNAKSAEIAEGHLFEPYYTLKLNYNMKKGKGVIKSCLNMMPIK